MSPSSPRLLPPMPLLMLYLAGIALGIAGVVFMVEGTSSSRSLELAQRTTTNGYVCLSIGSVFFLVATLLAFLSQRSRPTDS